jgi:hypothetical protein
MTPAGFEPAIPARERPQTHALDRAGPSIGQHNRLFFFYWRDNPLVGLGILIHEVCFLDHTQRRSTIVRTPLDE